MKNTNWEWGTSPFLSLSYKLGSKGYESPHHKGRVKDMILEGEQCKSHVGEDEVFCQEIQKLKQLKEKNKSELDII